MKINLFENLVTIISTNEILQKYSINLTSDEINFIHMLIANNPDFFNQISAEIIAISADNKITISDIPNVVLIVSHISNINFKNALIDNGKLNANTLEVVKCLICSILESGILKLSENDKKLLTNITISSFALLEHIPLKTIKKSFFKKYFSCVKF